MAPIAWRPMDGGGLRAEWGDVSGCVVQHGDGGVWEWWCRSADGTRCEGYAASEGEAKHVVGAMLRVLEALAKPERETITEVLRVTIEHGEDDLREWPMANQPPGALATIDRRAVSCVWGGPAWCWVHVSGGPPVMLGAPYADVVAWWRGGR